MKQNLLSRKLLKLMFLLAITSLGWTQVSAQANLALTGTPTHSGGGGGNFGPQNYNDQIIQVNTFGWVAGTGGPNMWVQYQWANAQLINQLTIFNNSATTRTLTAGDIQYWTGSAWQTVTSFNVNPATQFTVDFFSNTVSTTRIRIVNMTITGFQASNPAFNEIEVRYIPQTPDNAGITAFTSPTSFCSGTQDVEVTLINAGTNALTSADINWTVNGTPQPGTTFNGNLASFGSTTINLGTFNFVGNTNYTIEAWTGNPNGNADTQTSNDTLEMMELFYQSPSEPTVPAAITQCGDGTTILTGTPAAAGDSIIWYDDPTDPTPIGRGESFESPFLTTGTVATFYASGAIVNTANGGPATNTFGFGGFITPNAFDAGLVFTAEENITIERVHVYTSGAGDVEIQLQNSANVPMATKTVTILNGNTKVPVELNFEVPAGSGYRLIATPDTTTQLSRRTFGASYPYPIGNLATITANTRGIATWYHYFYDWDVSFRRCESGREPVVVTVEPEVTGIDLVEGNGSVGTYRTGTMADFDHTKAGDKFIYELLPPTGFTNAQFGTDWIISALSFETVNGTPVLMGDTVMTLPSGAGNGKVEFTPSASVTDSIYRISATIQHVATGCDATLERYFKVAPVPVSDFSAADVCSGDITLFTNNSTITTGSMNYDWDFGDGNGSVQQDPPHRYGTFGNYTVRLVVTSDLGYEDSVDVVINVNEIPTTSFTAQFACEFDNLQFTNSSTTTGGTAGLTYEWDFGDGNTSTATDPQHRYATPGSYTVTLTTDFNGCATSNSRTVYQFPDPVADYSSVSGCEVDPVTFTNSSTITSGTIGYDWDFGDGNTTSDENPIHEYSAPGTYDVRLIVTSYFNCKDTITQQVVVTEVPVADFAAGNVCEGTDVSFDNNSSISGGSVVSSWNFGDGNTSSMDDPTHGYQNPGTYAVTLTVTSGSCVDQTIKTVDVFEVPLASFNVEDVCEGNEVSFENTSSISSGVVSYDWNLGDGSPNRNDEDFSYLYTPGSYDVWLKVTSGNSCVDSVMQSVSVYALPNSDFNFTVGTQRGVTFTANGGGGNTYNWRFGDAGTATGANTNYSYFFDGEFEVTLIATTPEGCETRTTKTVPINTTGLNSLSAALNNKVSVYPNPSADVFHVDFSDLDREDISVVVYDMMGREVMRANNITSDDFTIDMSTSDRGIYLMKVNYQGSVASKKLTLK